MDNYSIIKATNLILLETIDAGTLFLEPEQQDRFVLKKGEEELKEIIPKIAGIPFEKRKVNLIEIPYSQVVHRLKEMSGKSLEDSLDGATIHVATENKKYDINLNSSQSEYNTSLKLRAVQI